MREGGLFMKKAFTVPNSTNYNTLFGKLVSDGGIMAASCIAQCTGCVCSCKCACRAIDELGFEW